ncbi:MAG: hypothetical protein JJU09_04350 [Rhodobacteraceae bacterium]|nr:hypothetical protein [Paracoccaceae bacterium]TVR48296.1 MAG: hypothetical protein EA386_05070 [Paracoccaceae bacterium]
MIVACFPISILAGVIAAGLAVNAGHGLLMTLLAYSTGGAIALVASMALATRVVTRTGSHTGREQT